MGGIQLAKMNEIRAGMRRPWKYLRRWVALRSARGRRTSMSHPKPHPTSSSSTTSTCRSSLEITNALTETPTNAPRDNKHISASAISDTMTDKQPPEKGDASRAIDPSRPLQQQQQAQQQKQQQNAAERKPANGATSQKQKPEGEK